MNHLKFSFLIFALFGSVLFAPCAYAGTAKIPVSSPQLEAARSAYFRNIEGESATSAEARRLFSELNRQYPGNPLIQAYEGSLDLLEAGRTWEVWNKHQLTRQGLSKLDTAVNEAPDDLEVRFIRAATAWHLPFFFHRRQQAEDDFMLIAPRAESAVRQGQLPAPIAAAALNYYAQILAGRKDDPGAQQAFRAAQRIAPASPAGKDAASRIR